MILIAALISLLACVPWLWRRMKEERHRRLLATQLRQSLQSMVHALRIGVGFTQALEYAARETEDPLGSQWRWLLQGGFK